MKKTYLLLVAIISYSSVFAQKYIPAISAGTEIAYTVSQNGESIQFLLNVNSIKDSVKMRWEVAKYGTGSYVMAAKSLEDGKKMILQAPEPDEVTHLSDNETMAFVSKAAFKSIIKDKVMQFDDLKFILNKETCAAIKVDDKELDVLHVISTDGKNEIWILNNPEFPLICRSRNSTSGTDFMVNYIR